MNRILRIDEEKPEMHITVQDYKVKQALLSAYAMPRK